MSSIFGKIWNRLWEEKPDIPVVEVPVIRGRARTSKGKVLRRRWPIDIQDGCLVRNFKCDPREKSGGKITSISVPISYIIKNVPDILWAIVLIGILWQIV